MATKYETAPDLETTPGYEAAMGEAREAGDGGPIDGFIERLADRVGAKASVRAVFGDPIERDGLTIIPVAKVRWGFGGGAGSTPIPVHPGVPMGPGAGEATESARPDMAIGSGTGAGGGVTADPVGYLEIGPQGVTFKAITPAMPSPGFMLAFGATAALVLRALARLFRR